MARPRSRILLLLLLTAAGVLASVGCEPASFTAGLLVGRFSLPPFAVVTTEITCFQDGVQVPCP